MVSDCEVVTTASQVSTFSKIIYDTQSFTLDKTT